MKRTPTQWSAPDAFDKVQVRSLEQLADTPEFREFLQREFPDGASELKSPLSRRSFMTLMGASVGLAGLAGCRRPDERILPYTKAPSPEEMVIGLPMYYATAMNIGSTVYGLLVESNEGRPTKIEGNPKHPMTAGASSVFVQASLLDIYDPERSAGPMRAGKDREDVPASAAAPAHGEGHEGGHGGHGEAAAPAARMFSEVDIESFLSMRRNEYGPQGGAGLYILSGALASPTLLAMRERVKSELPKARWLSWEPICDDNIYAGSRLAFGTDLSTHLHLGKADVVLSLGADPLGNDADSIRLSRDFATRRRPEKASDEMSRLYVVEAGWSITGTNADHRLRVKPSEVAQLAGALAAELVKRGLPLSGPIAAALPKTVPASIDAKFLAALADDIKARGAKIAIAVGRDLPREVHALVHAIHAAAGAVGTTVTYTPAVDAGRPLDRESLTELGAALDKGEVKTLVVLGGNPAYDMPVDFRFSERIQNSKAALVHLGLNRDETAHLATLHIHGTHFLEAWGDVRGRDGVASVVQPLIAPLFQGWSEIELVSFLLTGRRQKGHELVRDTWRGSTLWQPPAPVAVPVPTEGAEAGAAGTASVAAAAVAGAAPVAVAGAAPAAAAPPPGLPQNPVLFFDRFWRKALREGVIEKTAFPTVAPELKAAELGGALTALSALASKPFEIQFAVDNKLLDGRFSNNGWMQELPDPITKLVWDNAALLSMETAKKLGVEKDDMVRITVRGKTVDAAVYVQPGMASDTVVLALGYGRKQVGRIGSGAGFNAYALRHTEALGYDEAQLSKLDSKYTDPRDEWFGDVTKITGLVSTQDHFSLEGRPLVREASLSRFRHHPEFAKHAVHHKPLVALWDDPEELKQGQQWGLSIDLSACTGCGTCTVACQAENNIPIVGKAQVRKGREMHWIRIDRYFSFGKTALGHDELNDSNTEVTHQPVGCQHCEHAPCENVCPVAATMHTTDGLNDMVYNRCVGTRYCSNNCPWKVRRFNFLDYRRDVEFAVFGGETPEIAKLRFNPDVTVRSRGVIEKCTYCVQRIRGAQRDAQLKTGSRQVAEGGIITACQQACPSQAITFGDILDKNSRVAHEKQSPRNYEMLAELNARPRTSYLARIRNPNPALEAEKPEESPGAAGHHGAAEAPAGHGAVEHPAAAAPPSGAEHNPTHAGGSH